MARSATRTSVVAAKVSVRSHDLRAQARANNKQDFFVGPDLWYALQDIILETGDQQTKGIERLAADRSRQQILDIFAMMPLWETLREPA